VTTAFRAIAGLWLRGSGRISIPASEEFMFMPQRPYMPPGPLRKTLAYPSAGAPFADPDLIAACARVNLGRLSSELDRVANWDSELTSEESQRLAFARLLLHKPRWICIDDALDSLDEADRKTILTIFEKELVEAGVISLGRRDLSDGFSSRVVHLIKAPEKPV